MKKIFIINGYNGVGKDTFVEMCEKYVGTYNISTVDKVKLAAEMLGWNGEKNESSRRFLSDLKLLAEKHFNHSIKYVLSEKSWFDYLDVLKVMFIHCREPENIDAIKLKIDCETICIKNDNVKQVTSNMADANVHNYNYDYYIHNNGTLDDLEKMAKSFLEEHNLI